MGALRVICFTVLLAGCLSVISANDKWLNADEAKTNIAKYTGWIKIGKKRVHCGAGLVRTDMAVTAASCATNEIGEVIFGDTDRDVDEGTEQVFTVTNMYNHPGYDPVSGANDIAFLQLDRNATIVPGSVRVLDILPNDNLVERIQSKNCRAAGFGYIVPGASDLIRDQSVQLRADIITRNSIQIGAPDGTYRIKSNTDSNKAPCQGDVGAPVVGKRKGEIVLVGVIAAWNIKEGCEDATSLPRAVTAANQAKAFFELLP